MNSLPGSHIPPPSSTLPPLRTLDTLSENTITSHIRSLSYIYCPLAFPLQHQQEHNHDDINNGTKQILSDSTTTALADSGYASETDENDDDPPRGGGDGDLNENGNADESSDALDVLRCDAFERAFSERWLTGFISRAEELLCFHSEEACQRAIDQASWVLESFFSTPIEEDQKRSEELADYVRDFSFDISTTDSIQQHERSDTTTTTTVQVQLNDGLAGSDPSQPDDVGLQSWGASIVVSKLLCSETQRFDLTKQHLGTSPQIIELGAGTGLVSLVMAKLLPNLGITRATVIATDYHPAVLTNLQSNITTNFHAESSSTIQAAHLDWSSPSLAAPLDKPADMLIATDVIYAPEHATWLRDCCSLLLGPQGVFWLVATVRQNGRFEGVSDTVESAFAAEDRPADAEGRRLTILWSERLEKTKSVGRGDESGYRLFRIGWV